MIQTERARRSLREFTAQAWHVIEPVNPYIPSWHLDAIFEHLEAVSRGEIQDLLINMPPRHAKSIAVSVMWPVWDWINNPSLRWLFSSYSANLSTRDSLKCRRLIQSGWFQSRFGDRFFLTSDQNAKTRFDNDKTGYRIATSVDGLGTGEGGDRIVVDDPHNVKESESDKVRESTLQWWDETMSTRGNNPKTVARVIVMQRVHENDLSGHVLEKGGYTHLCLPAQYEPTRVVYINNKQVEVPTKEVKTELGFVDPRNEPGELLCPERFDFPTIEKLKLSLGSYATACQLQQRPSPRGGGIFKSEWFVRYKIPPQIVCRRVYGDTAQKTAERNDYSVFECWGRGIDGRIYLLDLIRGKWEAHELEKKFMDFWNKHKPFDEFQSCPLSKALIEDKVSGTGLIQNMRKKGIPIRGIQRSRDKLLRANDAQPSIEAQLVCIPESAPWVSDFTTEVDSFTKNDTHAHDDQIDPMMDAIEDLITNMRISIYD
jgi:predicted phage terminase large subunit-like protein